MLSYLGFRILLGLNRKNPSGGNPRDESDMLAFQRSYLKRLNRGDRMLGL